MATYTNQDSTFNSLECWDYSVEIELAKGAQDLQLAAELGKTLLERNKELENTLRQQQTLVDDQTQEIEYLTKQTTALREVNNSRLRIYEQLEVSIQELERNNQRLAVENAADKKQIKSLCHSLDAMETRCEEITRQLEEAQAAERRRQKASQTANSNGHPQNTPSSPKKGGDTAKSEVDDLANEVAVLRAQKSKEHRRAEELEEQLTTLIQENATIEEQLAAFKMREEQLRSFEEEITSMQGQQMCFRCMRRGGGMSTATPSIMDEDMSSSIMEDESIMDDETDLDTEVQSIASETHNTVLSDNPYRVLVEKYEALLSMQRRPSRRSGTPSTLSTLQGNNKMCSSPIPSLLQGETNCLSLQEELQLSGEFTSAGPISLGLDEFGKVEEGEPRELTSQASNPGPQGNQQQLYFSEAETNSSSGVSEGDMPRQQHRATQTDLMSGGGKLLWSFTTAGAGGASDCTVNVYDECADPTESRFQRAPEYKELFSEIFGVLKRSVAKSTAVAEAKAIAAKEEKQEKRDRRQKSPEGQKVCGQAEGHESDAGHIEQLERPPSPSPSSILSMSGGGARKSRRQKQRSKAERKAEQLRRKVLALTPEQFSQEKAAAAAAVVAGPSVPPTPIVQQQQQPLHHHHYQAAATASAHPSRDQSPAFSERSDRSGRRGGGRHWAKRGRPFNPGAMMPWTRYQQAQGNHPQQAAQHPLPTAAPSPSASAAAPRPLQQVAPASKPPPVGYTSTASADVARLKNLEKSYAEVLRSANMPKHRRK